MRRVIVVVLPEPAPARMQTGPRTRLRGTPLLGVQAVEDPVGLQPGHRLPSGPGTCAEPVAGTVRPADVPLRSGRRAAVSRRGSGIDRGQPRRRARACRRSSTRRSSSASSSVEPGGVDRRPTRAVDLRVRRRRRPLVRAPELLVQLLARAAAPVNSIAMSRSGSWPESRIMLRARSTIAHRARPCRARRPRRARRSRRPGRRARPPPGSS